MLYACFLAVFSISGAMWCLFWIDQKADARAFQLFLRAALAGTSDKNRRDRHQRSISVKPAQPAEMNKKVRGVALVPHHVYIHSRGGRMTKLAGVAASIAPSLGIDRAALSTGTIVLSVATALPSCGFSQVLPESTQCEVEMDTVTCKGDLSAGIDVTGPPYSTLNVNTVAAPGIRPASGVDGINFYANGQNITITSDTTGTDGIITEGRNANGIDALGYGQGNVTVTNNGTVTSADGVAIAASADNGNLIVNQRGNLISDYGISAAVGKGNIQINVTDDVISNAAGIIAFTDIGDITMETQGDVSAIWGGIGIQAYANNGVDAEAKTGPLRINSSGSVTGGLFGIEASNMGSGDLIIDARNSDGTNTVTGGTGIVANNYDGGALSIFADNVTGSLLGVSATNVIGFSPPDSSLSVVTTGNVYGSYLGIDANNFGTGDLTVTASNDDGTATTSGSVDGLYTQSIGIRAVNENGGALKIVADNTYGQEYAIFASNDSQGGSISITSNGTATSENIGIQGVNFGSGNLSVTAHNVTSTNSHAIDAITSAGGLSITATGTVSGGGDGISGIKSGPGNLIVAATNIDGTVTVSGLQDGIQVSNMYGGLMRIEADNVIGENANGIYAINDANGTGLTISSNGAVMGNENGIHADNRGTGDLTVSVSGMTMGVASAGVNTYTGPGGMTRINVNSGANVSGGTYAILNGPGNSDVFFNDGATVSGVTALGNGSDKMTVRNADISGVTQIDGGDDTDSADGFVDILTLDGFTGLINGTLINWEEALFDDSTASFSGESLAIPTVSLRNGTTLTPTQPGFTLNGNLAIDATSRFNLGSSGLGMTTVIGDVTNRGAISLADGVAGDRLSINGTLGGNGTIGLDVNLSTGTADTLQVNGNTSGSNKLSFNVQGSTTTPADIGLVTVTGNASAEDFALADPLVTTSAGDSAVMLGAFTYTLEFIPETGSFFLSPWTGMAQLRPASFVLESYPVVLTKLNQLATAFHSWRDRRSDTNGAEVAPTPFDFKPTAENAFWISLNGSQTLYDDQSTTGAEVDLGMLEFEMGMDFPIFEGANGRLIGGFSYSYQEAEANETSGVASGSLKTKGHAMSLSALWLADSRFYASGIVKFSQFSTDMALSGLGPIAANQSADGYAVSIEAGKAFEYSDTISLIPQVQLNYSSVSGTMASPVGAVGFGTISDGETSSVRLGLHAQRSGLTHSMFGTVSLIHAFDNETTIELEGVPFTTKLNDQRIEISVGGEWKIDDSSIFFGGLTASGGLGSKGEDYSYGAAIGLQVNF